MIDSRLAHIADSAMLAAFGEEHCWHSHHWHSHCMASSIIQTERVGGHNLCDLRQIVHIKKETFLNGIFAIPSVCLTCVFVGRFRKPRDFWNIRVISLHPKDHSGQPYILNILLASFRTAQQPHISSIRFSLQSQCSTTSMFNFTGQTRSCRSELSEACSSK